MVLFLGESEVEELLSMKDAMDVLEAMFSEQGRGNIINHPRHRVRTKKSMLHYLAGAVPSMNVMGYKAYSSSRAGIKFRVFLHDIISGELLSIMDGNYMGMIRTGAATGVATKHMARVDSQTAGIIGTGRQSKGQLMAIKETMDIKRFKAYSRNADKRVAFCKEMEKALATEVIPVKSVEEVLEGSDIIITSTTAAEPLFDGELIQSGVHINAIGANFLYKREIDEKTVRKSDIIVVEDKEQCRYEAGELLPLVDKGRLEWDKLTELGEVVVGKKSGRNKDDEITLFKSLGIAVEDIAIAAHLYSLAKSAGVGKQIDIPSI